MYPLQFDAGAQVGAAMCLRLAGAAGALADLERPQFNITSRSAAKRALLTVYLMPTTIESGPARCST
jgi:hypothetical protein